MSSAWLIWSAIVVAFTMLAWVAVYAAMRESPLYAVLYPLSLVVLLVIVVGALVRGQRVEWKSRSYVSR